ncbi:hypothetical protein JCM10207_001958 [Rhodosporidiobolus poonsookiae]
MRTAVLTVGSTEYTPLVFAVLEPTVLASLAQLGVSTLTAQVGNSALPSGWEVGSRTVQGGLQVDIVRFTGNIEDEVGRASVVVSHAGAGSILSFLRPLALSDASPASDSTPAHRRQLILVPNSTLMDSHQSDLADEMEKKGWATVCERPKLLPSVFEQLIKQAELEDDLPAPAYPTLDTGKVQRILDETLGFA